MNSAFKNKVKIDILKHKDKKLFEKSRDVEELEFGEVLDRTMSDMAIAMYSSQGIGLAGPQIGIGLKILVADIGYVSDGRYGYTLLKMVNPKVISQSEFKIKAEEECLSYPGLKILVERPDEVTISFKDPFGKEYQETYRDWQARVLLHEIDHFDGVTLYSRSGPLTRKKYDTAIKQSKQTKK